MYGLGRTLSTDDSLPFIVARRRAETARDVPNKARARVARLAGIGLAAIGLASAGLAIRLERPGSGSSSSSSSPPVPAISLLATTGTSSFCTKLGRLAPRLMVVGAAHVHETESWNMAVSHLQGMATDTSGDATKSTDASRLRRNHHYFDSNPSNKGSNFYLDGFPTCKSWSGDESDTTLVASDWTPTLHVDGVAAQVRSTYSTIFADDGKKTGTSSKASTPSQLSEMKIVAVLGDPSARVVSVYAAKDKRGEFAASRHGGSKKTTAMDYLEAQLGKTADCLAAGTATDELWPRCAGNSSSAKVTEGLGGGLYVNQIAQYLDHGFRPDQLLVVPANALTTKPDEVLKAIADHVDGLTVSGHVESTNSTLQPPSAEEVDASDPKYVSTEVRQKLADFYAAPNERLYNLLSDKKIKVSPKPDRRDWLSPVGAAPGPAVSEVDGRPYHLGKTNHGGDGAARRRRT